MILNDVCTRLDVLANDVRALEDFGDDTGKELDDKIRLAIETWLQPLLAKHGFDYRTHITRREPDRCLVKTGGAWSNLTDQAKGEGAGAINLRTVLATPGTDELYLGLDRPFRGVFVGMEDAVNTTAIASSLTYWSGQWSALPASLADATVLGRAPFARAGRIAWPTPADWLRRSVNDEGPFYWMRLQVNSLPSACEFVQLLPIVRSRLTQPTALKALALLYREGAGSTRGEWLAKATAFEQAADAQFQMVAGLIRDEFDVDDDGDVAVTEVNSVTVEPWSWERG